MDRIREARRGTMTAVNGGLSRRRQRGSSLRDSPEEDVAMETQEAVRLRDRGSKKDRDRERSNRKKRRRCDRMLHESHREGGQESSEDSVDEEDDDEEEDSSVVRLALLPAPNPTPSASLMQSHHLRKGYVAKPVRPLGACNWKVVEEMIGAPIPRKARSSSVKRSQECWVSGGGGGANVGGVGGDQLHWQTSTSPVRPSLSSTAPLSPSSSNASIRKNMTISGRKYRPPKPSKPSIQEIEIEVAEVLFGMTRQVTLKKDSPKNDSKESNEVKSSVSSPIPISSPPASQSPTIAISNPSSNSNPLTTTAPKRKRPSSSIVKLDKEAPLQLSAGEKTDPTYLVSENMASSAVENGGVSCDPVVSNVCSTSATLANMQQELLKLEGDADPDPKDTESQLEKKAKEEAVSPPKEESPANLDVNLEEEDPPANKAAFISDSPRAEKINIDLMAPPSGKSSLEMENTSNYVTEHNTVEMEMGPKVDVSKGEIEKIEKKPKTMSEEKFQDYGNGGRLSPEEPDSKKQAGKERNLELQLDLEKHEKDVTGARKHQAQKQQSRGPRAEPRTEKAGLTESLPLPMQIPGWPGGFPSFGYMTQVPLRPVGPVDASSSSSKTNFLPWQLRPKRCASHYYIAQNIRYHQQITRLNPFWPSAVGATPFITAKQYNLSTAVPSDSEILGNTLQGSLPGKSLGSVQEKEGSIFSAHSGLSTRDKNNTSNPSIDASHKKPAILQQSSQPGSAAGNIIAPAFIFPLNQQQAAAAVAGVPNRSGVAKLTAGSSNAAQSSSSTSSAAVGAPGANGLGTTMRFNYPSLPPNEAQYLAFLQNNAYPFPIPAHVGGAPPYRGATPSQAMPFFNLSFYPSQMLHPSQFRSQQQPRSSLLPPCSQQGHQNPSTSSGSSSSQKNPQQSQRVPAAAATAISACNSHGFPRSRHQLQRHPAGQTEYEAGGEDTPSTADSRVSQAQKTISTQKYAIPANSQSFALISPALTSLTSGGNHGEKQHPQIHNQVMKMDLTQSQALAMSFASFGGATASAGGAVVQGLDFSSMAQNHALFQSLPEATRHGYQISAASAHATQQQQQQQHKKPDLGKSAPELGSSSTVGEKGKLSSVSSVLGSVQQHSHTFSRADSEPPISTIFSNSVIDSSSRNLDLIQQPSSGAPRISSRPGSAAPAFNSSTAGSQAPNSHHLQQQHLQKQHLQHQQLQQQQLLHLQKQHQQLQQQQLHQQQRAKLASSNSNPSVYTDRLSGNSNASKFPQASPPALMQKSSASIQCPQWKAAPRAVTATSSAAPSPSASSVKNQISLQQQVQSHQQLAHQTHISFGLSPAKVADQAGQRLISSESSNAVSLSCAATVTVGSSHTSVSKNSGSSPLPSSGTKSGTPSPVLPAVPFQKQQLSKNSSSPSSTISPLAVTNPNMPSILGFPHIINSTSNSSIKSQPSSQHQPPKQHLPQSPQFFFSNSYMQNQTFPSDAAIAYFQQHQRPPPDPQQPQQKERSSPSAGMLSLGPSSSPTMANGTSDPSKAAGAIPSVNSKGLQHQAQFTATTVSQAGSRAVHPLTPYLHNMQSVSSLKTAAATEQKPAAGNDNLRACWQPEKR